MEAKIEIDEKDEAPELQLIVKEIHSVMSPPRGGLGALESSGVSCLPREACSTCGVGRRLAA